MTTRVQRHIADLICDDLLQCDHRESLLENYLLTELQGLYIQEHQAEALDPNQLRLQLEPLLEDALEQYSVTRTASADITNVMACTVVGAFAFQKFTPGGIGLGLLLAVLWAKTEAVNNFLFGASLGKAYYGLFPPEPSTTTIVASVALVLSILTAFASFAGLIADPVQAALGIHRRRLTKMIDHLEQDFIGKTRGSFRPKDQMIARILDVFDLVKSNLG